MEKPSLETTYTDRTVALIRGIVSACPLIGGIISEAVTYFIPNQKLDRITEWLRILDANLSSVAGDIDRVKDRLRDEKGLDLFEESVDQAARALSDMRRKHLANMLTRSLTQEELKHAESKKLLNILRELTDEELIMLVYYSEYSERSELGFSGSFNMIRQYPEILSPPLLTKGSVQEERDKAALQESYRNTLIRFGLLYKEDNFFYLTGFGHLLLHYILDR